MHHISRTGYELGYSRLPVVQEHKNSNQLRGSLAHSYHPSVKEALCDLITHVLDKEGQF